MSGDYITQDATSTLEDTIKQQHPNVAHVLRFFRFDHQTPEILELSREFAILAIRLARTCPSSPELTVALRALLTAKEAGARAMAMGDPKPGKPAQAEERYFATFIENNGHEGETWTFYIPVSGNEAAFDELRGMVDDAGYDQTYEVFEGPPVPESVVSFLCNNSRSGWMPYHNKLDGTLTLPPGNDLFSELYKGGIEDFVR